MGLQKNDIFLVNRNVDVGGGVYEWKAFQIKYGDLANEIGGEINVDIDPVGYQVNPVLIEQDDDPVIDATHRRNFLAWDVGGSLSPKNPVNAEDIISFSFHPTYTSIANISAGEQIIVNNMTTGSAPAYFEAKADGTNDGVIAQVEVEYISGDKFDINLNDDCNFRPVNVNSGGGSINIGPCPPGFSYNSITQACDPDPTVDVDEGTLWYNPMNGITYIYYVNVDGSSGNEGQWVDVRPGGGGGGIDLGDIGVDGGLEIVGGKLQVNVNEARGIENSANGVGLGDSWADIPVLL